MLYSGKNSFLLSSRKNSIAKAKELIAALRADVQQLSNVNITSEGIEALSTKLDNLINGGTDKLLKNKLSILVSQKEQCKKQLMSLVVKILITMNHPENSGSKVSLEAFGNSIMMKSDKEMLVMAKDLFLSIEANPSAFHEVGFSADILPEFNEAYNNFVQSHDLVSNEIKTRKVQTEDRNTQYAEFFNDLKVYVKRAKKWFTFIGSSRVDNYIIYKVNRKQSDSTLVETPVIFPVALEQSVLDSGTNQNAA